MKIEIGSVVVCDVQGFSRGRIYSPQALGKVKGFNKTKNEGQIVLVELTHPVTERGRIIDVLATKLTVLADSSDTIFQLDKIIDFLLRQNNFLHKASQAL